MKFHTQSGSVYEINTDSKKIRRLNGKADPTPRQGKDGEWRTYASLYPEIPKVGEQLLITWAEEMPPTLETLALFAMAGANPPDKIAGASTVTSPILTVEP